jgi:microsomal dipeptidase-like Zn-dependent dipeptidase
VPIPVFDLHCDSILNRFLWGLSITKDLTGERLLPVKLLGKIPTWLIDLLGGKDMTVAQSDIRRLHAGCFKRVIFGVHSFCFYDNPFEGMQDVLWQLQHLDALAGCANMNLEVSGFDALASPAMDHAAMRGRIGIEGAHVLACPEQVGLLKPFRPAYVSLCHGMNNWAATCSYMPPFSKKLFQDPMAAGRKPNDGLTDAGIELVHRLVEAGIPPDLAHCNSTSLQQACHILTRLKKPALCSHAGFRSTPKGKMAKGRVEEGQRLFRRGFRYEFDVQDRWIENTAAQDFNARAGNDHDDKAFRCVSEIDAEAIVDTKGLIGILVAPMYLAGPRAPKDSRIVAAHINALRDHLDQYLSANGRESRGIDHLAIGTDYDGFIDIPDDHKDCRDIQKVFAELAKDGARWTEDDLNKLGWRNAAAFYSQWAS